MYVGNNKQKNIKKSDGINYSKPQHLMKEAVSVKIKRKYEVSQKIGQNSDIILNTRKQINHYIPVPDTQTMKSEMMETVFIRTTVYKEHSNPIEKCLLSKIVYLCILQYSGHILRKLGASQWQGSKRTFSKTLV